MPDDTIEVKELAERVQTLEQLAMDSVDLRERVAALESRFSALEARAARQENLMLQMQNEFNVQWKLIHGKLDKLLILLQPKVTM